MQAEALGKWICEEAGVPRALEQSGQVEHCEPVICKGTSGGGCAGWDWLF